MGPAGENVFLDHARVSGERTGKIIHALFWAVHALHGPFARSTNCTPRKTKGVEVRRPAGWIEEHLVPRQLISFLEPEFGELANPCRCRAFLCRE